MSLNCRSILFFSRISLKEISRLSGHLYIYIHTICLFIYSLVIKSTPLTIQAKKSRNKGERGKENKRNGERFYANMIRPSFFSPRANRFFPLFRASEAPRTIGTIGQSIFVFYSDVSRSRYTRTITRTTAFRPRFFSPPRRFFLSARGAELFRRLITWIARSEFLRAT